MGKSGSYGEVRKYRGRSGSTWEGQGRTGGGHGVQWEVNEYRGRAGITRGGQGGGYANFRFF